MNEQHVDVVIVGAGLSGIGAAAHLKMHCPGKTYAVLEARAASGGTWDLFRYPGVRSDSDMFTLGYSFKPWNEDKAIADGASILNYVREAAREYDVDRHIHYNHRVTRAEWSSDAALWTVEAETLSRPERFTCNFLFMCSGYYDYAGGHAPEFPGAENFKGPIVHPQFWPENLDYAGKRVVIIGSGATAMTLAPAMAEKAAHVTMLQRSPTYVVALPSVDKISNLLRRVAPSKFVANLARWRNVLFQMLFFNLARAKPEWVKKDIEKRARAYLGKDYDMSPHFRPRYNPWDQRICMVPDGDLFLALQAGTVSIETDTIERFTGHGILLRSGKELPADIIITATGLVMTLMKGQELFVDGRRIEASETMSYKGMMSSDVPNFATSFGYTNASWTLKSDLTAAFVCRLLNYMDRHGYAQATPRRDPSVAEAPFLDFSSGYVQRALAHLPKQGTKKPWKLYQNYVLDLLMLKYGAMEDGTLEFKRRAPAKTPERERVLAD